MAYDSRLIIRIHSGLHAFLRAAAAIRGVSMSRYVMQALFEKAKREAGITEKYLGEWFDYTPKRMRRKKNRLNDVHMVQEALGESACGNSILDTLNQSPENDCLHDNSCNPDDMQNA